jgi:hypothetical protein
VREICEVCEVCEVLRDCGFQLLFIASENSASVIRMHFTDTFGHVFFLASFASQIEQLNMRLPEDGADVRRNA